MYCTVHEVGNGYGSVRFCVELDNALDIYVHCFAHSSSVVVFPIIKPLIKLIEHSNHSISTIKRNE